MQLRNCSIKIEDEFNNLKWLLAETLLLDKGEGILTFKTGVDVKTFHRLAPSSYLKINEKLKVSKILSELNR